MNRILLLLTLTRCSWPDYTPQWQRIDPPPGYTTDELVCYTWGDDRFEHPQIVCIPPPRSPVECT